MDSDDGAIANVAVDHRGGLWALRHAVPDGLRAAGHVIGCDIALRRGDVTTFRETVAADIRSEHPAIRVSDFGPVRDGSLPFHLVLQLCGAAGRARICTSVKDAVCALALTNKNTPHQHTTGQHVQL